MVSGDLDKDTNNCFLLKNLLSSVAACQGAVAESGLDGTPWREPEDRSIDFFYFIGNSDFG